MRFWNSEDGYVAVLALISMPFLMGLALIMWDVGRGNNLHTDVQNGVDAIALAGGIELDGTSDAIDRAEDAMTNLLQNQARFGVNGRIILDSNQVNWEFLRSIPPHDDTEINLQAHRTEDPLEARYVWVWSNQQPMESWFQRLFGLEENVDFQAQAVAMFTSAACNITPLFICNPFENPNPNLTKDLIKEFEDGNFHGKLVRLRPSQGNDAAGPGNFGFLAINDDPPSAESLARYFAQGGAPACFERSGVNMNPGFMTSVNNAINTRFDIEANLPGNHTPYPPAQNVRKGAKRQAENNACSNVTFSEDPDEGLMGFPDNPSMGNLTGGASIGEGAWDSDLYWNVNYDVTTGLPQDVASSFEDRPPSRHDVYTYEIENGPTMTQTFHEVVSPGRPAPPNPSIAGESGEALCYKQRNNGNAPATNDDRRVIHAAVINCNEHQIKGAMKDVPVERFVSIFLANPVRTVQNTKSQTTLPLNTIDVEIIGVSGSAGMETYIRDEVVLVR